MDTKILAHPTVKRAFFKPLWIQKLVPHIRIGGMNSGFT
jgi:hypothetical protein